MADVTELNKDQAVYWNGIGGAKWVAGQARTDMMLAPVSEALIARANLTAGLNVIDVGCGCGATTLEIANAVGPSGTVTALDVSEPMLGVARTRLSAFENVRFICGDAGTSIFDPAADIIFSRFGVMFFGDPAAAFANLRTALKANGRVIFACWRPIDENPWMQVPLHAAYRYVPRMPRPAPEDPGPFSFADTARVTRILTSAGFTEPRFTPVNLALDIAAGEGFQAAIEQATTIGAASRALRDQDPELQKKATGAIAEALIPYAKGETVILSAAIWLVECEPRR